jgi:hypothetical protein
MKTPVGLLLLLCCSSPTRADLAPIGGPLPLGSWGQRFELTGLQKLKQIGINMLSGTLEHEGIQDFSDGGWTVPSSYPTSATAAGSSPSPFQFTLHFGGAPTAKLSFLVTESGLKGPKLKPATTVGRALWDGCDWKYEKVKILEDVESVPEGSSLAFLALASAAALLIRSRTCHRN